MGVIREDWDWTMRVTWDNARVLLRVDVHGLSPTPQNLGESGDNSATEKKHYHKPPFQTAQRQRGSANTS